MTDQVDPALKQLHLYVCMMIELRDCALNDKVLALFELCKGGLRDTVEHFPVAQAVVDSYNAVKDPHSFPPGLLQTTYTDNFISDVNGIIGEIMQAPTPEEMIQSFNSLTKLIS